MCKSLMMSLLFCFSVFCGQTQTTVQYNLAKLLTDNKLITDTSNHAKLVKDTKYKEGISIQKIVWLKDVSFNEGTIDVDLRGKNVFLQSFLGIAFHGSDNTHYEVIYFRPFNFRHADTSRRRWSVQYMVVPEFTFDKLRKEHPLQYENAVFPIPEPDKWFHATIVISAETIIVYINHSPTSSLRVKRLVTTADGKIGLWDDELSGDFANLTITE